MSRPALNPSVFRALGAVIAVVLAVAVAVLAAPSNRVLASAVVLLVAAGSLAIGIARAQRAGGRHGRPPAELDEHLVHPDSATLHARPGRASSRGAGELRASRDELTRGILDGSHDGIVIADRHGVIVDWNGAAETILGWSHGEAVGLTLTDTVVPEEHHAQYLAGMRRYQDGLQGSFANRRIEVTARRRNGDRFPAELTIAPVRTGASITFVAFIRDITDRREAEQALRASE